ncbi:hypothetical protein FNF29_03540 [Cafeteria roenbergensis]|uniref:RRM domain-containing protein n=1 Tax=Cafeteria roenbergensis TaxID=33653 RepID=A0A5A8CLP0_CAFRO|nr:hypothetical protein FNF29_03540 [Cafeteria roenbergensis]|eukprot:KAA0153020.1 hypothetical protein FNF29_03540 [Cafeteria roenbergensis]
MAAGMDVDSRMDMSLESISTRRSASGRPAKARSSRMAGDSGGSSTTRVFVGNLSWSTTWQALKDHMSSVGTVTRSDVLTRSDGKSSGGAIVEFADPASARRAIDELTDTSLDGRDIFVREDREGPAGVRKLGAPAAAPAPRPGGITGRNPRLFVGNLSWDVSWQDLKDHFKSVGPVAHADVLKLPSGRSKGCGIVEFSSADDAARAVATMHDSMLKGRPLLVREDRESREYKAATGGASAAASSGAPAPRGGGGGGGGGGRVPVYFGNLAWSVDWRGLKDFAKRAGYPVSDANVMSGSDGRSRGFGVVSFDNMGEANAAIARLNGTELDGRAVEVRLDRGAAPGGAAAAAAPARDFAPRAGAPGGVGCRVRLDNLPPDFAWQEVKDTLRQLGCSLACRTEAAHGTGFATFDNPADAAFAATFDGADVNGRIVGIRIVG